MSNLLQLLVMLTNYRGMVIIIQVFRRSSMVEQEAVNFEVAGSSPAVGAKKNPLAFIASGFFFVFDSWI